MEVIPAIDLLGGRCVRLYQGDYAKESVYSDDPLAVASRWAAAGATRIHIVDLDGARDGVRANARVVRELAAAVDVPVQVGGGIRTAAAAAEVLDLGVERVIFGTAALEAPDEVEQAIRNCGPGRVIVGIDARDGVVAVRGWKRQSRVTARALMRQLADRGAARFMYTDITRDGTLTHPNFAAIEAILDSIDRPLIAAGGIAAVDDVLRLAKAGVEGVVVGKALYTGAISLQEAIRRAASAGR